MTTFFKCEIRSIDAWASECGCWEWNDSYKLADDIFMRDDQLTIRKIAKHLRDMGYLTEHSKGRISVVAEWPLYEIQEKNTSKPLLALMFDEKAYPEKPE